MARDLPTGRSTSVSMSDFNERAKRIAASTGLVEKGGTQRTPSARWRKGGADNRTPPQLPKEEPAPAEDGAV